MRTTLIFVDPVLTSLLDGARPLLPLLIPVGIVLVVLVVLAAPLPGRGPRLLQRRDPWRGFRFAARREVLVRAGGRCEGALVLAWGAVESRRAKSITSTPGRAADQPWSATARPFAVRTTSGSRTSGRRGGTFCRWSIAGPHTSRPAARLECLLA